MVSEAVQNYVNLVSGLTRTTRAKAAAGAKSLLASAGLDDVATDASERVSKLADEIVSASKANRELMRKLIASEVEQVGSRLGFVRAEEVERLRAQVDDLEATVRARQPDAAAGPAAAEDLTARNAAAHKAARKKTAGIKAAKKAKKTPLRKPAPPGTASV